jgi:hypothetical protein
MKKTASWKKQKQTVRCLNVFALRGGSLSSRAAATGSGERQQQPSSKLVLPSHCLIAMRKPLKRPKPPFVPPVQKLKPIFSTSPTRSRSRPGSATGKNFSQESNRLPINSLDQNTNTHIVYNIMHTIQYDGIHVSTTRFRSTRLNTAPLARAARRLVSKQPTTQQSNKSACANDRTRTETLPQGTRYPVAGRTWSAGRFTWSWA